jgi:Tat protein secretion system quality control protein TatD with DNase activity
MRASTLTIMATRSQDQNLVAEVAALHSLPQHKQESDDSSTTSSETKVVPSFGWHPWFSHQIFDDTAPNPTYNPSSSDNTAAAKAAHYQAVLQPAPEDQAFIDDLPTPTPLSEILATTRSYLTGHPLALVGEVGLDKAFRLPQQWIDTERAARNESLTPGGREGRTLSPHRVRMQHQQAVLTAQLRLAGENGRAVSVHGVQAHGVLYETVSRTWAGHEVRVPSRKEKKKVAPGAEDFSSDEEGEGKKKEEGGNNGKSQKKEKKMATKQSKQEHSSDGGKPYPPRICLHSYSGSADMLRQWMHASVPARVYVSFSTAVNLSTEAVRSKVDDVIRVVPDDRVLLESDLHQAGDVMDGMLEDMYRRVCQAKGWELEDGVERIGRNYEAFVYG